MGPVLAHYMTHRQTGPIIAKNITQYYLKTTSRVAHFSVTDREQPGCSAEAEAARNTDLDCFRVAMASPLSVSTKMIVIQCSGK